MPLLEGLHATICREGGREGVGGSGRGREGEREGGSERGREGGRERGRGREREGGREGGGEGGERVREGGSGREWERMESRCFSSTYAITADLQYIIKPANSVRIIF